MSDTPKVYYCDRCEKEIPTGQDHLMHKPSCAKDVNCDCSVTYCNECALADPNPWTVEPPPPTSWTAEFAKKINEIGQSFHFIFTDPVGPEPEGVMTVSEADTPREEHFREVANLQAKRARKAKKKAKHWRKIAKAMIENKRLKKENRKLYKELAEHVRETAGCDKDETE